MNKNKKMHMIGNAHLDPVWVWRWQEGFGENKATLKSMLDRLDEYDDLIITSSSALFYSWIEENDPELFQRAKKEIKRGRIILCGGWWVQPDCNIPSGESFARHALIAQNYFNEKFQVISKTGYCVDSFGHNGMLPQILKQSRMEQYVFMRPCRDEKGIEKNLFLWESIDGTQIKTFRLPGSYCAYMGLSEQIDVCMDEFVDSYDGTMCFYGVGNHGGGPTIANIEEIKKRKNETESVDMVFSSPNHYFDDVEKSGCELPVIKEDLQHHASGCYSAHSEIKKLNRESENALLASEKFAVLSNILINKAYPAESLDTAWKNVLFNQFHDILAGTSLKKGCEDAVRMYGESLSICMKNTNSAIQAISFKIPIEQKEGMTPIVVFNPNTWDIVGEIEVEFFGFKNHLLPENPTVYDREYNALPTQIIPTDTFLDKSIRLAFCGKLPSMGYTVFYIDEGKPCETATTLAENVLENEFLRVVIDAEKGGILEFYDKTLKQNVFSGSAGIGTIVEDDSDTWSHNVTSFNNRIGSFDLTGIEKIESGEVRSVIRVIGNYNASTIVQDYILYSHKDQLDVRAKVNWQEQFKCLKLDFPINIKNPEVTYEIPYGHIQKKPNGEEEPMQNWFDLSGVSGVDGSNIGVSVLNNGKYSGSALDNMLSIMVLRSPVYVHHIPQTITGNLSKYSFIDQGIQEFQYSIVAHSESWRCKNVVKRALELNQLPEVVIETYHDGVMPLSLSMISCPSENIVISCVKKHFAQDKLVIRCVETFGIETEADIYSSHLNKHISVSVKPYEVKTLIIEKDFSSHKISDMIEW